MKRIFFAICFLIFSVSAFSQTGIQNVILEKYYISTAGDVAAGVPLGSVTYRIWVDLAPGWKLNAVYGNSSHNLRYATTTTFYNADFGAKYGNSIAIAKLDELATMIDSWASLGAAANGRKAVLKADDIDGAIANINGYLQGANPLAGTPISVADGIGTPAGPAVTELGITTELDAFDGIPGNLVLLSGGSYAILGGTTGTGTDNLVLIAQVTTEGGLSYDLNLSVQNTTTSVQENWVYNTPLAGQTIPEFTASFLHYAPNALPVVSITAPTGGSVYVSGDPVNMAATATDSDGTITQVEFFVDGVSVGVDNTGLADSYDFTWTSTTGTHSLTAVATDNAGSTTTSAPVSIQVGANTPPTCSLAATPNTGVKVGNVVALSATAADAGGSITQVQFFVNGVSIGTIASPGPYSMNWTAVLGTASITAVATDNGGLTTTSNTVAIIVLANVAPSVSITAPSSGTSYNTGATVHIVAGATDTDGTITGVEFYLDGSLIAGSLDVTSPYEYDWTSVAGTHSLTAKATDNDAAVSTSAAVSVSVVTPGTQPYKIQNSSTPCSVGTFCLPVVRKPGTIAYPEAVNCIGYDIVLNYDKTLVSPTGIITIDNDMITPILASYSTNIIDSAGQGQMIVSLYLNSSAPIGTSFHGNGTLFCAEFNTTSAFVPTDVTTFRIFSLTESFIIGNTKQPVENGTYSQYKDNTFSGVLKFWNGLAPIGYAPAPASYLLTTIFGNVTGALVSVSPDLNGVFNYNTDNGPMINFDRDINAATAVMPVINGADALLTKKVLIDDLSFIPSVFQVIAMDVNMDGVITAGDLSQINQRTVKKIDEFKQAWNYSNVTGLPIPPARLSKDWLFVDNSVLTTDAYNISTTYPYSDGTGFSKYHVPAYDFSPALPITGSVACPSVADATYTGILVGDIDGNYKNIPNDGLLKNTAVLSDDDVVFNLNNAIISNGFIEVPVSVNSQNAVNALDFAMNFNHESYKFVSIVNALPSLVLSANYATDATLSFTSYSTSNYPVNQPLFSVRFEKLNAATSLELDPIAAYTNGEPAKATVLGATTGINDNSNAVSISVYPNPSNGIMFVQINNDASLQLLDICGKLVVGNTHIKANQSHEMNVSALAEGVYFLKVQTEKSTTTKKVVIKK